MSDWWAQVAAAQSYELKGFKAALMRSVVVLLCGVVAFAIPNFAVAMGFMGSLTLSCLVFIFPSMFYLKLHGERLGGAAKAGLYLIAITGVVGAVTGIASTILLLTDPPSDST